MKDEPKKALYNMEFTINKRIMAERVRENKGIYRKLNQLILKTFEGFRKNPEEREE